MAGVKGMRNNPAGRPPGAIGAMSRTTKEKAVDFINSHFQDIWEIYGRSDDATKIKIIAELMPYVMAKMTASSVTVEGIEEVKKTICDLFPDQLDANS